MVMERHFDDEMNKLNENLLKMAALVEGAIQKSIEALKSRDKELAQLVISDDNAIDELENIIEEEAVDLLALFQPMARDLRFVTTGMKISSELERIADLCTNICQRVIDLSAQPLLKPLVDIPKLAQNAKGMVKGAIDAFVNKDEKLARDVILSDKISNELRDMIAAELINDFIVKDGKTAPKAIPLILITRDLERISDHATNIAEDVIYMVKAKVVKHHLKDLTEIVDE
jgi:phosphate transport system protein